MVPLAGTGRVNKINGLRESGTVFFFKINELFCHIVPPVLDCVYGFIKHEAIQSTKIDVEKLLGEYSLK